MKIIVAVCTAFFAACKVLKSHIKKKFLVSQSFMLNCLNANFGLATTITKTTGDLVECGIDIL